MLAFIVALALLAAVGLAQEPVVKIGQTTLVGRSIPTLRQEFFGGIPFAEPPVGNLRFKPPVAKFSLGPRTFTANNFGSACPQEGQLSSEDCLTINVLRPAGIPSNASLPVMVWVYGGGFDGGDASIYNASAIVAQSALRGTPIVYVNFNYRIGALGFPQGLEATSRNALNLGLKDQLLALQWVQRNIGSFGGDSSKVTAFGESAGAISLSILLLNPSFEKLARAVIFESGSASTVPVFEGSSRENIWQDFVSGVPECATTPRNNTFSCLQTANVTNIVSSAATALAQSLQSFVFVPVLDGPRGVFPELPSTAWERGSFARLPLIAGTNLDEGTAFIPTFINSTAQLRQLILANTMVAQTPSTELSRVADRLLTLYPDVPALGSPFGTGNETFGLSSQFKRASALFGDVAFQSQRRAWTQAAIKRNLKVFSYLFTDHPPTDTPQLGVHHGLEVLYVYGFPTTSPSVAQLSQTMIDYWVSFATSLDPNDGRGSERPIWGAFTARNQRVIELNSAQTKMIPDTFRADQISFINSVPVTLRHKRHDLN